MKESTLVEFGGQFIKTLSAQYQLPELRGLGFESSKIDDEFFLIKTPQVDVEPTGQLACIVKRLSVYVEMSSTEDGKHIRGTIHYRYQHHNGGSNGSEQSFTIVTESRYSEPVYAGAISERLAYSYQNQLSPAS